MGSGPKNNQVERVPLALGITALGGQEDPAVWEAQWGQAGWVIKGMTFSTEFL